LHEPIVLFEDKILDGRHRHRACIEAGIEPRFENYEGDDPLSYVVSLNLKRRHLSESQRAMVAAKLATLGHGQRQTGKFAGLPTQAEAAALLNVSERTVRHAAGVRDHGAPELQRAVEQGDVKVSVAADIATLSKEEQRALLANFDSREILDAANEIRARKGEMRRAERIARMIQISKGNADLPTDRTYPIILADPPWQYERPAYGIHARSADELYPPMGLDEICALPVGDLGSPDALLFLWVPAPILEQAFQVIRAWGFSYRTGMVWDKQSSIPGRYIRQQHEHLLIARRGEFPTPPEKDRPRSIISSPRRGHSQKPDEAYELIERMYPDLPKIELFARGEARPGWTVWGNEARKRGASEPPPDPNDGLDIPGFLLRPLPQEPASPEGRR
jgi:N6-adenosine-specific RNA methylase IME4